MSYRSRLTGDLDRWIAKGWIDAGRREDILGDIAGGHRSWTAIGALMILGAVLLAMSALTFVAANWDAMPRLLRFATIALALWLAMAGAGRALDRGADAFGHALALLGVALFGAGILLTAQTFNMTSFRNTAVLVWTVAALATAVAIPSRPVLILATLLGAFWAGLEVANPFVDTLIWGYLPVWGLTFWLAWRLESRVSMHLLALALVLWTGHALHWHDQRVEISDIGLHAAATLIYGALALAGALARDRGVAGGGILAGWTAVTTMLLALLLQVQFGERSDTAAAGAAYYALSLGALAAILLLCLLRLAVGRLRPAAMAGFLGVGAIVFLVPVITDVAGPGGAWALPLVYGALFYAGAVALILQGSRDGARATGVIGIAAFIGQTLYAYAETFGGLLDTALFFFVGGLILFALSYALWAWRRRNNARRDSHDSEEDPA
jgi:uncharacterized membrane protein